MIFTVFRVVCPNGRRVCTYSNAFLMVNPNKVMNFQQFSDFWAFLRYFDVVCRIESSNTYWCSSGSLWSTVASWSTCTLNTHKHIRRKNIIDTSKNNFSWSCLVMTKKAKLNRHEFLAYLIPNQFILTLNQFATSIWMITNDNDLYLWIKIQNVANSVRHSNCKFHLKHP